MNDKNEEVFNSYIENIEITTGVPSEEKLEKLREDVERWRKEKQNYHHSPYSERHLWDDYMAPSLLCVIKEWQAEYSKRSGKDISESKLESMLSQVVHLSKRFDGYEVPDDLPRGFGLMLKATKINSKLEAESIAKVPAKKSPAKKSPAEKPKVEKLKFNTKRKNEGEEL
tara:strand:- start:1951 stop:2460 length:510 start_codon:yes stop_codon:yes gene_type:complete